MIKSHEHEISASDHHDRANEAIVSIEAESDDKSIADSESATSNDDQIHDKEHEHQH